MNDSALSLPATKIQVRPRSAERSAQPGLLIALACLLGVGVLYYASVQRLRTNAAWVDHTHQVLTSLDHLLALTTDSETAERGYVITGDEDYLTTLDNAASALDQVEQQLKQLVADNALQERRVQHLTDLVTERVATLRAVDSVRRRDGFAAAQELIREGAGKRIHGQLRQQIDEIANLESALLRERQRRADRGATITSLLGVASSLLALLFVVWAAFAGYRDRTERRRVEAEREAFKERLRSQLEDMRRLHQFNSRLIEISSISTMLEEVLEATIELQNADFGNIQLYDPQSGTLAIVAQRGFSRDFLDHFRVVSADDPSVCGRALQRRARVVVEDVDADAEFTPHRSAASQAGFRAVQSTPIFGRDGSIKGVLSTHFRMPHRPSDQDFQLTDLYLHTAAALIERAQNMEAVRSAREEADRANAAKGRFLSSASHDLRQPLQTLSLLNGALRRLVTEADAAQAVEQQRQAIASMSELIDALLNISKLQSGAVKPRIADFAVSDLFSELHAELSGSAARKNLRLEIAQSSESVLSDRTLLGQILRNLLGNAIRYTRSGSVRLECRRDGPKLRIDVVDTGVGIAEEQLQSIFEEFYQVEATPGSTREGHGLGLNIVQRTARLLNHELSVESRLGEGSVFSIWVPLGTGANSQAAVRQRAPPNDTRSSRGHVLLVDDDKAVLEATRLLLRVEGYSVTAGTCLSEAIEQARENRDIELLITDFHLSDGKRGTDVMQAVQEVLGRRVNTILVTGDTSSAVSQVAQDSCVRLASKPIRADELLGLVLTLTPSA